MKIKNIIIILLATTMILSLAVSSAWAGNVQRNRWEGVAIGIGAAFLGHALFYSHYHRRPAPQVVYRHPISRRHAYHYHRKAHGYGKVKECVPRVQERRRDHRHYSDRGYRIEERRKISKHRPYRRYD